MTLESNYRSLTYGDWHLRVLPDRWNEQLWRHLLTLIGRQVSSRHPQTVRLRFPDNERGDLLFLKVFHSFSRAGMLKDYLRESKAFRSLRQGIALSRAGFLVPTTIVAGEERSYRFLKRAFVLTLAIPGEPMPVFLQNRHLVRNANWSPARKRSALENLAREIQRLHELGFIHGDLVPSNIMVTERPGGELEFYLMDNDRTRRYPPWFPQTLWKRNLVQLNRFPLPGISLQDRMRFFRSYAGRPDWNRVDWRLLGWLERKTRARRKECDAVDDTVSFRRLMRWDRELVDPNPSLSRERRGIFSSRRER